MALCLTKSLLHQAPLTWENWLPYFPNPAHPRIHLQMTWNFATLMLESVLILIGETVYEAKDESPSAQG